MDNKRFCIICGAEVLHPDPNVVLCPAHSGAEPVQVLHDTPQENPRHAQPLPQPTKGTWQAGQTILNTYQILSELGKGGFGKVYRVRHRGWNIELAVKRALNLDEKSKQIFTEEAEKWVDLGLHPNIITCYYVRSIDGFPHTFAELAEGGSLEGWIQRGKYDLYEGDQSRSLERILDIAIQFAWGLAYAHAHNLVHQDVKPGNVLMTPTGIAKVSDFGLARSRPVISPGLPARAAGGGLVSGGGGMTIEYRSPEQAAGLRLSHKTDIWSWAVSILEMFNGGISWLDGQGAAASLDSYLTRAGEEEDIPAMPPALAVLLKGCFQADPLQRPADMQSISNELQRIYSQVTGSHYAREVPLSVALRADSLNNRAVSFLDLGREGDALKAWQEALQIDPSHFEAVFNYGYWRWAHGQQADDDLLEQVRAIEPRHGTRQEFAWLLGMIQAERGDLTAAIENLKQAWQAGIHDALPPLVGCLVSMQDSSQARTLLEQAERSQDDPYRYLLPTAGPTEEILAWHARHPIPWRHCRMTIKEHQPQTSRITVTPDGKTAVSSGLNQATCLDLVQGSVRHVLKMPHEQWAMEAAISPDGQQALLACSDETLRLWDLVSGKELWKKRLPCTPQCIATTPDFATAVIFDRNNQLQVWDPAKAVCRQVIAIPGENQENHQRALSLSADGHLCLLVLRNDLLLVDLARERLVFRKEDAARSAYYTRHMGFSADGKQVLMPAEENALWLWDIPSDRKTVLIGHHSPAIDLAISPDAAYSISVSSGMYKEKEDCLRLWSLREGRCLWTEHLENDPTCLALLPDSSACVVQGQRGRTYLYDLAPGQEVHARSMTPLPYILSHPTTGQEAFDRVQRTDSQLQKAGLLERNQRWAEAYAQLRKVQAEGQDPWKAEIMEALQRVGSHGGRSGLHDVTLRQTLSGHTGRVFDCVLHPDGKTLFSCSDDGFLKAWDLWQGQCVRSLKVSEDWQKEVAVYPDGRRLLVSGGGGRIPSDHAIRLFDLPTPTSPVLKQAVTLSEDPFQHAALLPTRGLAANLVKRQLVIFNPANGQVIQEISLTPGYHFVHSPHSLYITPDSRFAFTSSTDDDICAWDLGSGKLVKRLKQAGSGMRLSADKRFLISRFKQQVFFWDLASLDRIRTLNLPQDAGEGLTFSADSRFLFAVSGERTVQAWDVDRKVIMRSWLAHDTTVKKHFLTPDERYMLSASWDMTIKLWELDWEYTFPNA